MTIEYEAPKRLDEVKVPETQTDRAADGSEALKLARKQLLGAKAERNSSELQNASLAESSADQGLPKNGGDDSSRVRPADSQKATAAEYQKRSDQQPEQIAAAELQERLPPGTYKTSYDTDRDYQITSLEQGPRVKTIEGWLKLQPGEPASIATEAGKDRGHLIGKQFGGAGDYSNVILMDPRINRSFINSFESAVAKELTTGRELYMKVSVDYGREECASKLTYQLYERQGDKTVAAGGMVIDPNTSREYTLKASLSDESARDWSNPFTSPNRKLNA